MFSLLEIGIPSTITAVPNDLFPKPSFPIKVGVTERNTIGLNSFRFRFCNFCPGICSKTSFKEKA